MSWLLARSHIQKKTFYLCTVRCLLPANPTKISIPFRRIEVALGRIFEKEGLVGGFVVC